MIVPVLYALLAAASATEPALRVGAGVQVITPDVTQDGARVYLAGFDHGRFAAGVHDDLWARSIAIADRSHTVVLTALDLIGVFRDEIGKIHREVYRRLGGRAAAVELITCSTHTHSGPDAMGLWGKNLFASGRNEPYFERVRSAAAQAIITAIGALAPARFKVGEADVKDLIRDTRDPQVIDGAMHTIAFFALSGEAIATMAVVACHPEVLWDDNDVVTSDFPHYLRRRIERELGGTAVYFSGAIGGLATPRRIKVEDPMTGAPAPQGSFRMCELYGEELARRGLGSIAMAPMLTADAIDDRRVEFTIPLENFRFKLARFFGLVERELYAGEVRTEVSLLAVGPMQILAVPGELYPELWLGGVEHPAGADFPDAAVDPPIRDALDAPHRILIGLANDELGYLVPEAQWDADAPYTYHNKKAPYGEVNSVGPQAAAAVAHAATSLILKP